ncbi:helix-turn-helix transcriptional regulator [Aromatoleum anaerobium]|uniref:Transcriptional regulator n=1 Tax=Aromatoleum anaerobium TaxID=182180 RepID=A0ABX1PT22_9RHOO|nr:transcriptional regulator [Aromatoleum anaerobium]MCK0508483.1 helix-turn-helix domain-containing protein [Aromatoleum anaerobium]
MQPHSSTIPTALSNFDSLPDAAMVDVKTVAAILGKSESSIWRDARTGKLQPIKTGPACTRWNVGAIRRHLAALSGGSE